MEKDSLPTGLKPEQSALVERQRLDKWLFFARFLKSRSLAEKAIDAGDIRVNDTPVRQSSFTVKTGDMVTIGLDRRDLVVRVLRGGARRGPYEEARLLYDDLTPPPEPLTKFEHATRERGSGRPTKKDRREIDRFNLLSAPDLPAQPDDEQV